MSAAIDSWDGVSLLWLLAAAAQPLLTCCNPYALLDKHTKPWKIDYAFQECFSCYAVHAVLMPYLYAYTTYDDDPKVNMW